MGWDSWARRSPFMTAAHTCNIRLAPRFVHRIACFLTIAERSSIHRGFSASKSIDREIFELVAVVQLRRRSKPGAVVISQTTLPRLWAHCREPGYGVVADVHSTPTGQPPWSDPVGMLVHDRLKRLGMVVQGQC